MSEKNASTLINWRILESRILDFGIHNSAQESGIQYLKSIEWNPESKGVLVLHLHPCPVPRPHYSAHMLPTDLGWEDAYRLGTRDYAWARRKNVQNRPFARWRHFTTTTRIHYVFPFVLKFGNPSKD